MKNRFKKIVIVTKKTMLEELVERFNTEGQARFYLEHSGQDFEPVQIAHEVYHSTLRTVLMAVPREIKHHKLESKFLPQYKFEHSDLVIAIGPDGLVVNVAKYLDGQPIIAINPDPETIDGILLPFNIDTFSSALKQALAGNEGMSGITLAEAIFSSGQKLLAFNDFFIGAKTHVSARYEIQHKGKNELHSSSGIIVSTGAGSTGWMRSVYTGAQAIAKAQGAPIVQGTDGGRLPWKTKELIFAVREPFPSKITGTSIVFGKISKKEPLIVKSHMPQNGVIFSDGIESDFVSFNSGETATVQVSDKSVNLIT